MSLFEAFYLIGIILFYLSKWPIWQSINISLPLRSWEEKNHQEKNRMKKKVKILLLGKLQDINRFFKI